MKIGTHGNLKTIEILRVLQYWMFVNVIFLTLEQLLGMFLVTLEYFNWLTFLKSLHGLFSTLLGYYFCIGRHKGAVGLYMGLTFSISFMALS